MSDRPIRLVSASPARSSDRGFMLRLLVAGLALVAVVVGSGFWALQQRPDPVGTIPTADTPKDPVAPTAAPPPVVAGRPLFTDWPKESPDLVLVVSGQTFGYLSPCGCSRPQFGGLERRFNFIRTLKDKGWEVAGLDLGDVMVPPGEGKGLPEQAMKKYAFTMKALKEMNYVAVGLGKSEFAADITQVLGQFAVGNEDQRPILLAGNLVAVERDGTGKLTKTTPRAERFKGVKDRPMIDDVEVYGGKKVSVGVIGATGLSAAGDITGTDKEMDFTPAGEAIRAGMTKLTGKADLKVLLLQGSKVEAMQAAKDNPGLQLIVCLSDESEPPALATPFPADKPTTQIVQVGHKGRYVGVVGVFKTDSGLALKYQSVPLGEEYMTPEKPAAEQANTVLQLLESYAKEVQKDDLLAAATVKRPEHSAQVINAKAGLTYVGADACKKCHAAEVQKWSTTKHAHAYDPLVSAKHPGLRNFDPECIKCHTTGFEFITGFESKAKTPQLLNNGCENCHGPGSGHAADPKNADLLKSLAPWKRDPKDKLPDLKFIEKMAGLSETDRGKVEMTPAQQNLVNSVRIMCMRCHDLENDPKFDVWSYLPKIYHSGLKDAGLPGGAK